MRIESGDLIPVERKKTRAPRHQPFDGDLIQATAYCVLVEERYGQAPPFMRIQYADRCFDEPYTPKRKQWGFGDLRAGASSAPPARLPPLTSDRRQMPKLRPEKQLRAGAVAVVFQFDFLFPMLFQRLGRLLCGWWFQMFDLPVFVRPRFPETYQSM